MNGAGDAEARVVDGLIGWSPRTVSVLNFPLSAVKVVRHEFVILGCGKLWIKFMPRL